MDNRELKKKLKEMPERLKKQLQEAMGEEGFQVQDVKLEIVEHTPTPRLQANVKMILY